MSKEKQMTTEEMIAELKRQKKEIEDKIKELRNTNVKCGRVEYRFVQYNSSFRDSEHKIYVIAKNREERNNSVIIAKSKESVIADIQDLVDDLLKLKDRLQNEN